MSDDEEEEEEKKVEEEEEKKEDENEDKDKPKIEDLDEDEDKEKEAEKKKKTIKVSVLMTTKVFCTFGYGLKDLASQTGYCSFFLPMIFTIIIIGIHFPAQLTLATKFTVPKTF